MNLRAPIVPTVLERLHADLRWLDHLIHREILRLRATYELSLDEFRGLYVSDDHVDALIRSRGAGGTGSGDLAELDLAARHARVDRSAIDPALPFARLSREFGLSLLEQDILVAVAAPEIEPKYETLYAYLNNDVTRKAPALGLLVRLLGSDAAGGLAVRAALAPDATLLTSRLVDTMANGPAGSVATAFRPHPALAGYLLGLGFPLPDAAHEPAARAATLPPLDAGLRDRLRTSAAAWTPHAGPAPVWLLHGHDAALRASAGATLCAELGLSFTSVDLVAVAHTPETLADLLLRQRLLGNALRLLGLDRLLDADAHGSADAAALLRPLARTRWPTLLDCETPAAASEALRHAHLIPIAVADLDRDGRTACWRAALAARNLEAPPAAVAAVADGFALAVDQIDRAAQALADEAPPDKLLPDAALAAAARAVSDRSIARLAQRMPPVFGWDDLVLPTPTLARLDDLVHAVRDRHRVFGDWGLARRAGGAGLRVLFSGPSGTGKTMAAATVARALGLDAYRVDVSRTVSKYIGETEKNLERIFAAAARSNAILFFDEADALFGKRSEVKDAHDRYSNIETAFLLQRIEDYAGVVILASNLSRNMDTAFSRRLNFVIDFPLPDRDARERLWRVMLAEGVPVADDVDIGFLAAQFPLSGGEIRNVTIDAAFLAARSPERRVGMRALIVATARELTKQGRAPSPAEFKHYHRLLADGA